MEVGGLVNVWLVSGCQEKLLIILYFDKTRGEPVSLNILIKANSREICDKIYFPSFSEKKLTSVFLKVNEIQG